MYPLKARGVSQDSFVVTLVVFTIDARAVICVQIMVYLNIIFRVFTCFTP